MSVFCCFSKIFTDCKQSLLGIFCFCFISVAYCYHRTTYRNYRIKLLIVKNLWCVGMHHWGPKQLVVGAGYHLEREIDNHRDPNAVCIYDGPNRKANLIREDAFVISKIIDLGLSRKWLLKPKEDATVKNRRTGPQQRCSICCKTSSNSLDQAIKYLSDYGFSFEIKDW